MRDVLYGIFGLVNNLSCICCAFGVLTIALFLPGMALAGVSFAPVFSNGMVLQRDVVLHIWGRATPHDHLRITFAGLGAESEVDAHGKWEATLGPLAAGGPHRMIVSGAGGQAEINDVLIGEVWVCGGQSNMALGMKYFLSDGEIAAASNPEAIRFMRVPMRRRDLAADKGINLRWWRASNDEIGKFSAVCYLFGEQLQRHLKVPVGLISIAVGGSSAEAWVGEHALANPVVRRSADILDRLVDAQDRRFIREHPNGYSDKEFYRRPSYRPTELFEMMVKPVAGYAARGVVWYQGESHRDRHEYYDTVLAELIRDWRDAWRSPQMPFLLVQLPSYGTSKADIQPDSAMAVIRNAQARVAGMMEKVGMVVTLDCGDESIHPKNKRPVATRLFKAARAVAYGEKIAYSGPVFKSHTIREGVIEVEFSSFGGKLVAKGQRLRGFFIAGKDKKWVEAHAVIDRSRVILRHESVVEPVAARYAWSKAPLATLFDSEGLPAGPFRTDDWSTNLDSNE